MWEDICTVYDPVLVKLHLILILKCRKDWKDLSFNCLYVDTQSHRFCIFMPQDGCHMVVSIWENLVCFNYIWWPWVVDLTIRKIWEILKSVHNWETRLRRDKELKASIKHYLIIVIIDFRVLHQHGSWPIIKFIQSWNPPNEGTKLFIITMEILSYKCGTFVVWSFEAVDQPIPNRLQTRWTRPYIVFTLASSQGGLNYLQLFFHFCETLQHCQMPWMVMMMTIPLYSHQPISCQESLSICWHTCFVGQGANYPTLSMI